VLTDADIFGTEKDPKIASIEQAPSLESWLEQWLEAKPTTPATPTQADAINAELENIFQFTRVPNFTTREEAIDVIMTRPDLAAQVAKGNYRIPFLNAKDSAAVRSALKLQLKAEARAAQQRQQRLDALALEAERGLEP
jgi:hypothetical protein